MKKEGEKKVDSGCRAVWYTGATARFTPTPMSSLYTMLPGGFYFLSRTAGPLGTNRPTNTTHTHTKKKKEKRGRKTTIQPSWLPVSILLIQRVRRASPSTPGLPPAPLLHLLFSIHVMCCSPGPTTSKRFRASDISVWWRYDDDLDDDQHGDDLEWKKRKQMKSNSLRYPPPPSLKKKRDFWSDWARLGKAIKYLAQERRLGHSSSKTLSGEEARELKTKRKYQSHRAASSFSCVMYLGDASGTYATWCPETEIP